MSYAMPTFTLLAGALVPPLALPLGVPPPELLSVPQAESDRPASASAATPTTKDPRTRRNAGLLSPERQTRTGCPYAPRCESDHDSAPRAPWCADGPDDATSLHGSPPRPA